MSELQAALREAFEADGHDVAEVSVNRDRVRVVVLEAEADPDELESIVHGVVDPGETMGMNVSAESVDGQDVVGTAVTFRRRG